MNRENDDHDDPLSQPDVISPVEDPEACCPTLPAATQGEGSSFSIEAEQTPNDIFPDEIIETQSDALDLAIQEAIRASTPKRRAIKIVKKKVARPTPPLLTVEQILQWADAWHLQHGKWPNAASGLVGDGIKITWNRVNLALRDGLKGLPGGSSLVYLFTESRGVRNKSNPPTLTREQILEWADLHKERTGRWPICTSGAILESPGETWLAVNAALIRGSRGLPGGSSLAVLLAEARGRRHNLQLPPLTETQILQWADNHHEQTGDWPRSASGAVLDAPEETWECISACLSGGHRSLPGGSSLASLLMNHRGVRNKQRLPHLSKEQILQWADAYQEQHGKWPTHDSGPIEDTLGETWYGVAKALHAGIRGLPGDTTLPRLLGRHHGAPYKHDLEPLSMDQILAWADAWYLHHSRWPLANSGPVFEGANTTWMAVQVALKQGVRGLPGGSSLSRLLTLHRGVRHRLALPALTREQILEWADLHKERTGQWPTEESGVIPEAPDETWKMINRALRCGRRGFPGGSSLFLLLTEEHGPRSYRRKPILTETQILQWANAYHARTGKWPNDKSGPIPETPSEETWAGINNALTCGTRGLSGGSSLAKLLAAHRGS